MDKKRFPGGLRVWVDDETSKGVGLCTTGPIFPVKKAVPIAPVEKEETELEYVQARLEHALRFLNDAETNITNLLTLVDHIMDCDAFDGQETCMQRGQHGRRWRRPCTAAMHVEKRHKVMRKLHGL